MHEYHERLAAAPDEHEVYTWPACGFRGLATRPYELWPPEPDRDIEPPYEDYLGMPSYEICPQCGFEFGWDDNPGTAAPVSFDEDRTRWITGGHQWFYDKYPEGLRQRFGAMDRPESGAFPGGTPA